MVKARMKWTSEKPTELGWYRYRGKEFMGHSVMGATYLNSDSPANWMYAYMDAFKVIITRVDFMTGEWAGPIPEPTKNGE